MTGFSTTVIDMETQLRQAYQDTDHIIRLTQDLKSRKSTCLSRHLLVQSFLNEFTLTQEQIQVLTNTDVQQLDLEFFKALKHLQKVNTDARELMAVSDESVIGYVQLLMSAVG